MADIRRLLPATAAMVAIVGASNYFVQFPFTPLGLQDLLTWGAFTYPVAFLVTDLTNRSLGPQSARRVVYAGFAVGVALSIVLATPRIAMASGTAFLAAQLLDIAVFDRLRQKEWWRAPLFSSLVSSALDTALFFSLAFAGTGMGNATLPGLGEVPVWVTLAIGDFVVKLICALSLLAPYGAFLARVGMYRRAGEAG